MNYRPEIDGLRALAVVPVILFHAGFEVFSGGFIGVDVFFVISGYLICGILINEISAGTFSLVKFYDRRTRRIFPALFTVVLACIPFAWLWMLPDPLENFGQSVVATVFFSNNILLYLTSGYWDLASEFKPLTHTWSLGVEEQYYIVFPIFLYLLWKLSSKSRAIIVLVITFASFFLAEWASTRHPEAAFYLLPTRAWELMLGVLCAFYIKTSNSLPSTPTANVLSIVGFILITYSIFAFDGTTPFPGFYALIPSLGAALIILFCTKSSLVGMFLGNRVAVAIGLLSYSAYLWHQPMFAFAKIYLVEEPSFILMIALSIITFVLSYLSWKYIERPFRDTRIMSTKKAYMLLGSAAVILLCFGAYAHKSHGIPSRVYSAGTTDINDLYISYNQHIFKYKKDAYTDNSDKLKLLIIGNSVGRDLGNVLLETYDMSNVDMVYRDDMDDCSVLKEYSQNDLIKNANVILFASSYSSECATDLLAVNLNTDNIKIYFVGPKHFGYNLNWIARVRNGDRKLLKNPMMSHVLEVEQQNKKYLPEENYISLLEKISEKDMIFVTDELGRLISADRMHLTKYGAEFVGRRVLLDSAVSDNFVGLR